MPNSLRILIAEDEQVLLDDLREMVESFGHEVVATVATGKLLVERCRDLNPDLVITDIKMPNMDGLTAAQRIAQNHPVPVVIVSAHHDTEFIERAMQEQVLAYLVKPVDPASLKVAILLAMHRFSEFKAVKDECDGVRQALKERKTIERAKGIIMKRMGIDEPAAFLRLQKIARDQNKKLAEIAETIITSELAFTD